MGAQVYFALCDNRIKIGMSTNVASRLAQIASEQGAPIDLLGTIDGWRGLEKQLHLHFQDFRIEGEWFHCHSTVISSIRRFISGDLQIGQPGEHWFSAAARKVFPKDAGYHLHLATGFPKTSCYQYAAGKREPPTKFIRTLLQTGHGEPFFRALMDGCAAQWWQDLQRERHIGSKALDAVRDLSVRPTK